MRTFEEIGGESELGFQVATSPLELTRRAVQMRAKSGEVAPSGKRDHRQLMSGACRFGEDSAEKMVDWMEEHVEAKDTSVLDGELLTGSCCAPSAKLTDHTGCLMQSGQETDNSSSAFPKLATRLSPESTTLKRRSSSLDPSQPVASCPTPCRLWWPIS